MAVSAERAQALTDEYNDLFEEYCDCDDQAERCRCVERMREINQELSLA